ncbi:MAG: hypothetical protein KBT03_06000 [Bacteroidales bacterium]|nr:hypothetical protein [Candidatus Scybalousia scybalohippi]
MTKKQRGQFTATVTAKTYPGNPNRYWIGEVKREGKPTIFLCSRNQNEKTEAEMRDYLQRARNQSLEKNSNIEEREHRAGIAEAQMAYLD